MSRQERAQRLVLIDDKRAAEEATRMESLTSELKAAGSA